MEGSTVNKKGREEKNKRVKAGPCLFPFKYKGQTYNECLDTPNGKICATEINNKNGIMTKYGYCLSMPPPRVKKSTVKKAPAQKAKTPSPVKAKTPSPVKAKTPSPVKAKTPSPLQIKSKKTTTLKKMTKLKLSKKETIKAPSPAKVKIPSPAKVKIPSPAKVKSPAKTKKTTLKLKKKVRFIDTNLKPESVINVMQAVPEQATPKKRWNESFIKVLEELADIMMRQGEPFKAKAYQKAQETIMTYEGDIYELDQIKNLPGIGKTIESKLDEFMQTGTLRILERERTNPVNLLTKVYGIGPKKAEELVKAGVNTIEDLRARPELLNDVQLTGLKYFEAIETRIPRGEIDQYKVLLSKIFKETVPAGSTMEIVGSYRRGAQNSGDIDIIITNQANDTSVMKTFMDRLIKDKIVIEVLSRGKTKSLTIAQLPKVKQLPQGGIPRRVDFLYTPPSEYAFALLYFTGSKIFNTVQRARALKLGYSLNEHGLYYMEKGTKEKGQKVPGEFPDEKSIFDFLGMVYKEPAERIDGRGVTPTATLAPAPVPTATLAPVPTATLVPATSTLVPATSTIVPAPAPKEKSKRKTLKIKRTEKTMIPSPANIMDAFKMQGISALQGLSEDELSQLIRDANTAYYCNQVPLMADNEYDVLREYTLERFPQNIAAQEGHTASCAVGEKNKVTLPYEMWSMDKIKPDTAALDKWKQTYKGPYVLSCKLDGVSGLYSTEGAKPKLYTRGNGTVGQDISHFLPYLNLPKTKNITLRGEFIVSKDVFKTKYAKDFANSRNFVAGLINQKKPDPSKAADISFVTYEVLQPQMKPSEQMQFLTKLQQAQQTQAQQTQAQQTQAQQTQAQQDKKPTAFSVVEYQISPEVTNQLLSEILIKWRAEYAYEIDGVICINDALYPRKTGNPEHAFAFKMVLSDQIAEAKVVGVIWTASKDGYLKPRVQIEPVNLSGVRIEFATGFNAKFIEENKIGVGALIRLVRSGDVIPHIIAVVQPALQVQMPDVPYEWNSTHVDIMLMNKDDDMTVKEKNITSFFSSLEVDGLGAGNVKKIIAAGYDTVPKILAMGEDDFLKVQGFKIKMAQKVRESIWIKVHEASLPELMHATNIFGRGFGTKKFKLILEKEPTILTDSTLSSQEKIKRIAAVDGLAMKTAEQFIKQVPAFIAFLEEANLSNKLQQEKTISINETVVVKDTSHPLYGKQYLMTGFRDKALIEKLSTIGAEQGSAVRKNTFVVLVKDLDDENSKTKEAKTLGIPIMSLEEFKTKYNV
jgi:DNA ligase (NAD+)